MALVPDALINPPEQARTALPDVLGVLEASGYGVLQLPPKGGHGLLLAVIAHQGAENAHPGHSGVAGGGSGGAGGGVDRRPPAPPPGPPGGGVPPPLPPRSGKGG